LKNKAVETPFIRGSHRRFVRDISHKWVDERREPELLAHSHEIPKFSNEAHLSTSLRKQPRAEHVALLEPP
jgi:hypothetical protein